MKYRSEIDGLRAVAVVPVILFHAGFEIFSSGFVGVDVFFVISGYLITSIIVSELERDKFSLLTFYERRARRILPALFFVLFACLPFAWMWLLPNDMKDFAQSLVAVSTFSSNILFWRETGYFATAAELKPLLHTWSLAVEEQYYIFFPLFMMFTWRFGLRWVLGLIAVAFIVSLGLGHWGALHKPAAAFFLLPTRAWELLIGVLAAFYLRSLMDFNQRLDSRVHQGLSLLGLIMVIYSIFAFDKGTPFPGLPALVPTMGTGLIILFASQGTWVNRLLSTKGFVGIGMVSYSAYLWHQPLMVFARHRSLNEPSQWLMGLLCIVTLLMAYISWRYVERPFREKQAISRRLVFSGGAVMAALAIVLGLLGHFTNGYEKTWLARQTLSVQKTYAMLSDASATHNNDRLHEKLGSNCRFGTISINSNTIEKIKKCVDKHGSGYVILGDSHAQDLFELSLYASDFPFIIGISRGGCRPHTPMPKCHYEDFLNLVKDHPDYFSHIVYEQAGFYLLQTGDKKGTRSMFSDVPMNEEIEKISIDYDHFFKVFEYLESISHFTNVIWFGSRIEPHISRNYIKKKGCKYSYSLRKNQIIPFMNLDNFIKEKLEKSKIQFISQNYVFNFDFSNDFMNCQYLYWSDGDHFSSAGAKHFAPRFSLIPRL